DDPILKGEWLKPGAHVNAIGCVNPMGREVDTEAVAKSRLFFDQAEAAKKSGDIAIPLGRGEITEDGFIGDIGSVLAGDLPGRTSAKDITMFKSVGISAVDVAAALVIFEKAAAQGLGIEVEI
ncbi:MAG: ornithine cyclodeaminase family protein, partial [Lachnospiraceae bacterium]|nr:ornithine cyclodeaminase family protein [Lachnospiraceae bacterium]